MKRIQLALLVAAVITLGACAQQQVEEPPPGPTEAELEAQREAERLAAEERARREREAREARERELAAQRERERLQALLEQRVYFDFDESEIKREFIEVIAAHATYLAESGRRVTLEGHCDERGTREYNIGLGERRARAVRQAMMAAGAPASQMDTVSYGEERPLDPGHNEQAWSQNRRVEFTYR